MMDFMDSFRRGVDRAGFELDRLLRANRVRAQIGGLRSRVDEELRQIGRQVVDLYDKGEPIAPELQNRCERIKQLQSEIAVREAELAAINQETPVSGQEGAGTAATCPKCGVSLPANAAFCPACGVDLRAQSQTPSPEE